MFEMFPFMFNSNNNNLNHKQRNNGNLNIFDNILGSNFINGMVNTILSSDFINDAIEEIKEDNYDVNIRDYGQFYLVKGYLPGLSPKDIDVDFKGNKVILTIKSKQTYSNRSNSMVTIIQTDANIVKDFYVEEIDIAKLKASFNDGLLLLTLPKVKGIECDNINYFHEPDIIDVENYKVE
jgi:HSP20 family protein